jgi:hypothetical protein
MTSEIVKHTGSTLTDQIEWTRLVTDGDRAGSILPEAYRGKPANVLIAVGLGSSMGLSPAESLYRIAVIKGKPTAGAELIAANVRKAGHKLRVTTEPGTVTATVIRSDDPDFPFSVTRDLAWAQRMGLAQNDNYKKQLETMLQWRAISAVARLACPEALYGVQYTPDEAESMPDATPARRSAAEAFTVQPEADDDLDTKRRRVAEDIARMDAHKPAEPEVVEATLEPETGEALTDHTRRTMFAMFGDMGLTTKAQQIPGIIDVIGRPIESRSELTEAEGVAVVDALRTLKRQQDMAAVQAGEA